MLKWIILLFLILGGAAGGAAWLIAQAQPGTPGESETAGDGQGQTGGERNSFFNISFGKTDEGELVQVDRPTRGDLYRTVSAPGSIEPERLIEISSQISAQITALPFREGERVEPGDVVVRLDPQNLTAAINSANARLLNAEARLDGAKADLVSSRLEFERVRSLLETGDVTEAEFEQARAAFQRNKSNVRALEADIAVAEADIERAQEDLRNTVIESPIAGIITALNAEEGETAIVGTTNTPGSVIMEIADLSKMLVIAQVDETNIAPVREDQRASVFINAYPDREFRGTVQRIGLKRRETNAGTGYFEVEILLDLDEGTVLRSGLTASVEIEVEQFFDVLKLPTQAVVDRRVDEIPLRVRTSEHVDRSGTFTPVAYRYDNGRAIATPVRIGPSDLTHTVIEAGLEPDANIITGPYRVLASIKDDQRVRDEAEAAAAKAQQTGNSTGNPADSSAEGDGAASGTDDAG